jgi:NitT/TauT family transport system ATP-binding protein
LSEACQVATTREINPLDNSVVQPAADPTATVPPRPAVDIRHLSLVYSGADAPVTALDRVSLRIDAGDFVSLIGPSGCGKTTLLRVIADLEQPTSGDISVLGLQPDMARRKRAYGYVFQAPALYPWRTVERNVTLPLEIMGLPKAERRQRAANQLELVGLAGFSGKYPWQLSGGMQQRVSIARALAFEPNLLLMDEPFGALDEITRDHLNAQLSDLWRKTGKTCIFVTHSISEAVFLSTRIVVMSPRPGRILDVIDCDLPRERRLEIRESSHFQDIAARVRQGLAKGHSYDD